MTQSPRNKDKPPPVYDNECPGCGNLSTFSHATTWVFYCKRCRWGFGHPQIKYTNLSPLDGEHHE